MCLQEAETSNQPTGSSCPAKGHGTAWARPWAWAGLAGEFVVHVSRSAGPSATYLGARHSDSRGLWA